MITYVDAMPFGRAVVTGQPVEDPENGELWLPAARDGLVRTLVDLALVIDVCRVRLPIAHRPHRRWAASSPSSGPRSARSSENWSSWTATTPRRRTSDNDCSRHCSSRSARHGAPSAIGSSAPTIHCRSSSVTSTVPSATCATVTSPPAMSPWPSSTPPPTHFCPQRRTRTASHRAVIGHRLPVGSSVIQQLCRRRSGRCGVQQDLRPALDPLVELVVALRRLVQRQLPGGGGFAVRLLRCVTIVRTNCVHGLHCG